MFYSLSLSKLYNKLSKAFILLTIIVFTISEVLYANDEYSYDNIFGSDSGGGEKELTDNIITPFIVLGLKKGEIAANIKGDMSIASIEKTPFLKQLKTYLKPSIYKTLSQINTDYILVEDLPDGVKTIIDENLNFSVDLTPDVMSDISPEVYMNKPKVRNLIQTKARSLIADINLGYNNSSNDNFSASMDNKLRFDNYYLSMQNNFADKVELFENYKLGYAAKNYDVILGNANPPTFAGLYNNNLLGVAITNSLISGSVVLESDPRYINLNYESEIKIYLNDNLIEEKTFPAGRHRLNIPINNYKNNLKITIKDKYGRQKTIDFSFAGKNANKIPTKGQKLYFIGIGYNPNNESEIYSGIEIGINPTSKIQLATLLNNDKQIFNTNYYRATNFGNTDSYLSLLNEDSFGFSIKNKTNFYYNNLAIGLGLEYADNYYQNLEIKDSEAINLNINYSYSNKIKFGVGVEKDFAKDELVYDANFNYKINNNANLFATYNKDLTENNYQIGFEYKFGENTDINNYYDNNKLLTQIKHKFDNTRISFNNYGNGSSLRFNNETSIFNNQIIIDKQNNNDLDYELQTNFAIVATKNSIDFANKVSNSGFITLKTDEDFISNMQVEFLNKKCYLEQNTTCTINIPTDRDNYLNYNLDNMPLNVKVSPDNNQPIFVPKASGKLLNITTKELFFIQGTALKNNKPLSLLIGEIVDENGKKVEIFTDEEGAFFAEGVEGDYQIQIGDDVSKKFSVDKNKADEGLIDVGVINL